MNPQFYAFRWITLLLTQEFPFPDAVSLRSAHKRFPDILAPAAVGTSIENMSLLSSPIAPFLQSTGRRHLAVQQHLGSAFTL